MFHDAKKTRKRSTGLSYELNLWQTGLTHLCGVDEVGRGSLAGPVLACAVIFDKNYLHPEATDSKLLSAKIRNRLTEELCRNAIAWQIGVASVDEIDLLNIRQATFLAMRRAILSLKISPDYLLVDGESLPNGFCLSQGIIKGDQKSFTIAAASIIAKESRDQYMVELSKTHPEYHFENNKGYGTRAHREAIRDHGICKHHRKSFVQKIITQ